MSASGYRMYSKASRDSQQHQLIEQYAPLVKRIVRSISVALAEEAALAAVGAATAAEAEAQLLGRLKVVLGDTLPF